MAGWLGIILVVVGLVFALATSLTVLGWVLFGLGLGIVLIQVLFLVFVVNFFSKNL